MKNFKFADMTLEYLRHSYNDTDKNMRTVEVPIIKALIAKFDKYFSPIIVHKLEIGNVLSHYFYTYHKVLDRDEKIFRRGLEVRIKEDLMSYQPEEKFDLIVSISTIEHIGFGKYRKFGEKEYTTFEIISKIKDLLNPKGVAFITLPVGYNPNIDRWLLEGHIGANQVGCMHRISDDNQWEQCSLSTAYETDKHRPKDYPWSTGMVVLRINN